MKYEYDIAECERQLLVKGLQQSDVARKAGVSKMSVSNFFRGVPVRNKIAVKIIKAIGADAEKIVRLSPADIPIPLTAEAEHALVGATKRRRA